METVRMRTMTRKSTIGFGRFADMTVQGLIDCGKKWYIRYAYYCLSTISFTEDVLNEAGIYERNYIEKPGTDLELYEKVKARCAVYAKQHKSDEERLKDNVRQKRLRRLKAKMTNDEMTFSKGALQAMNNHSNCNGYTQNYASSGRLRYNKNGR